MAFHRLTAPSYFGGLPGGYDYINNLLVGTPSIADGPRATGPNLGTYFLGFAEDAVSQAINRGLKALAENTDTLDGYLHLDLAIPAVTADVTAGAPVTSIVLTGPIFIGMAGTPNTIAGIRKFITLVDGEDNEIFNAGVECAVTAISPDVPGNEWSVGNVTLTISPAILAGVTYRVYYNTRGSTATLTDDALIKNRRPYNRYNGGVNWADGTTNPATFVTAQLDKIISELAAAAGANKVGYDGGPAWADLATNPATTVGLQLDKIITDLADPLGFLKIGATPFTPAAPPNAYGTASDTVGGQFGDVVYALNLIDDAWQSAIANEVTDRNTAIGVETTARTTFETPLTELRGLLVSSTIVVPHTACRFITARNGHFNATDQPWVIPSSADLDYGDIGIGDGLGVRIVDVNTATSTAKLIIFPIDSYLLPFHGKKIITITATVTPNGIGGQPMPAMKPSMCVRRTSKDGQTTDNLYSANNGWTDDPTTPIASYQVRHTFVWTADQNNTIDVQNYSYDILFQRDANGTYPAARFGVHSFAVAITP